MAAATVQFFHVAGCWFAALIIIADAVVAVDPFFF
jgi:hypothetical protein